MDIELGSLTGYRQWFLDRQASSRIPYVKTGLPFLSSMTHIMGRPEGLWHYGVNQALCVYGVNRARSSTKSHDVPMYDCTCGIYSLKVRKTPLDNMYSGLGYATNIHITHLLCSYSIQGCIDIFGKIIIHEDGYRSEYAKVQELYTKVVCTLCAITRFRQRVLGRTPHDCWTGDLGSLDDSTHLWTFRTAGTERLSLIICDRCFREYVVGMHNDFLDTLSAVHEFPGIHFQVYREINASDLNEWFLKVKELYA